MSGPVEIRELTPELLADFLGFFEGEAFADNPGWASCYCQFLYVDHARVSRRRARARRIGPRPARASGRSASRACSPTATGSRSGGATPRRER